MDELHCCICGPDKKGGTAKGVELFKIPLNVVAAQLTKEEKVVACKRRDEWLKLLRENVKQYPVGKVSTYICSQHFHSGKPADLHDFRNVDWLPSLNLSGLGEKEQANNGIDPSDHNYSAFPGTSGVDSCQDSSNDSTPSQQQLKPSEVKCCVEICGQVKGPDVMLFRFPQVDNYPLLNRPAVAARRDAWLKAVDRENIMDNQQALYICSKHFPGKRPAPLICVNHIDWKPTLLLERETTVTSMDEEVDPLNVVEAVPNTSIEMTSPSESPDVLEEPVVSPTPSCCDSASKLQVLTPKLNETKAQLNQKSLALEESLRELRALKKKLFCDELRQKEQLNQAQKELVIADLRNNDKATKFYTGLKSWSLFTTVFNAVHKPTRDFVDMRCVLTKQQEFLLALMRLRLNLTIVDLSYRFRISDSRASNFCVMWVNLIFYNLPASNISGPGPEMPKRKYSVEDKMRRHLKKTFAILSEEAITKDMYSEDKMGFSFLYKATYVCDYLMKMNNDAPSPTPNE